MPKKTYFQVEASAAPLVAVRFPHGKLDESTTDHKLKWKRYRKRQAVDGQRTQENIIMNADLDGMTYQGKHSDISDEPCDHYIGVLDKESGKLKVIPVELYNMHPVLKDKEIKIEAEDSEETYRQKNDALVKEFGSGKMQRAVNKRLKNKLDSAMLTESTQSAAASTPKLTGEQPDVSLTNTPSRAQAEVSAVPPHNKDASRPEDVYKLEDIMPAEVASGLDTMAKRLADAEGPEIDAWEREKYLCPYVLSRLRQLSVREDARTLQSRCLALLQCLVTTHAMKFQQYRLKNPFPDEWGFAVKRHILKSFFVELDEGRGRKKRSLPRAQQDLLRSHILVLALKLSAFCLPLQPMVTSLGLPLKRLQTHLQLLGCTVRGGRGGDGATATLTVPFTLPEPRGPPKKKAM